MKKTVAAIAFSLVACSDLQNNARKEAKQDCVADSSKRIGGPVGFEMRNGTNAKSGEYEFMGMVYAKNMKILAFPPLQTSQKSCSGALVCSNVVLTAGHCIADGELPRNFSFHTGTKPGETPLVKLDTPRVTEYKILHKDGTVGRKDIALLRLDRDLKVKPGKLWLKALPELTDDANGPVVKIVGYGNTKHENGNDTAGGTKKIGKMVYQGHMDRQDSDETHQMAILHPEAGLDAALSETTNACSGDSGGATIVGDRIYGVLAKIMYSKDGKLQSTPTCKESNITLVAVLAKQKNWLTENLEKMCSGGLSLDDDAPPFDPVPTASIADEKKQSDSELTKDKEVAENSGVTENPCE